MYLFYIIALIPVVIGMLLFFYDKNITLIEWIVGSIVAFVVAGTFHFLVIRGMTSDVETWSGYITNNGVPTDRLPTGAEMAAYLKEKYCKEEVKEKQSDNKKIQKPKKN